VRISRNESAQTYFPGLFCAMCIINGLDGDGDMCFCHGSTTSASPGEIIVITSYMSVYQKTGDQMD
jgi:hypothetical protein